MRVIKKVIHDLADGKKVCYIITKIMQSMCVSQKHIKCHTIVNCFHFTLFFRCLKHTGVSNNGQGTLSPGFKLMWNWHSSNVFDMKLTQKYLRDFDCWIFFKRFCAWIKLGIFIDDKGEQIRSPELSNFLVTLSKMIVMKLIIEFYSFDLKLDFFLFVVYHYFLILIWRTSLPKFRSF